MFSLPGNTIGDAWFVIHDGVAHCFFCTSPPNADWHWDIGHAVSRDLVHWEYVDLALERGTGATWDSQILSTGSVLRWDGRFWMAYSALRKGENPPTRKVHRVGIADRGIGRPAYLDQVRGQPRHGDRHGRPGPGT